MKIVSMVCPNCGASIQVDADKKNLTCNYCGNNLYLDDEVQHIQYDNAEETGYQFEKGRQRAQAEARQNNTVQYRQTLQQPPVKKRRTWLWVLGWIFIFPIPLTILLLRKKEMKPVLKYGLIAVAWVLYLAIGLSGGSDSDSSGGTSSKETTVINEQKDSNSKENETVTEDVADSQDQQVTQEEVKDTSTETIAEEASDSNNQQIVDESESSGKKTLEDITYVELNELQKLFINLTNYMDREEINTYISEHGLKVNWFGGYHYNASSCYIGLTGASVSSRPRDREGEVIYVQFENDGTVSKFGYALGGSVSYFDDFELIYEDGKFSYDGESFDDGEAAMQLYLANNGITDNNSDEVTGSNDDIDKFITDINASGEVNLVFQEDFVPSDKNSEHYKTEFRLTAYRDALGKSYKYGETIVDIILSSSGKIQRIYMDGASYEQCISMVRYASPLLDDTVTDADIQSTIDYLEEHKSANGYYYAKLGLLMLGGGDKGYEFMLK